MISQAGRGGQRDGSAGMKFEIKIRFLRVRKDTESRLMSSCVMRDVLSTVQDDDFLF